MKTALITGASSGNGKGTAIRLAHDGWRILVHGRRVDALEETLNEVRAEGGEGEYFTAEMADIDQIEALSDWATSSGGLHDVVRCAAKFTYGPVSRDRFEDWDLVIDQVLRASIRLTADTLPAVINAERDYVYICGPTSWTGRKNHSIHCAVRHTQAGFAHALFEDVHEDGVRVTLVHLGFGNTSSVKTDDLDRTLMIKVEDISEMIATAVSLPNSACVTEMKLRPQRSLYI